ncbi:NAD-dependent epimerase/dehydratase family protein [Candidatus Bathyarchaeota archaeon]|nr:NAD-dependent epimerase/dehydratase family protein [Candidatus Bathyarchaeota archaeon]
MSLCKSTPKYTNHKLWKAVRSYPQKGQSKPYFHPLCTSPTVAGIPFSTITITDYENAQNFQLTQPRLREDGLYCRAMSRFIMQASKNEPVTVYGEGKQTRSFCYITDTATGLMLLAQSREAKGEVVNVGNSQEKPF